MNANQRAALETIRVRLEQLAKRLASRLDMLDETREAGWIAKAVEAVLKEETRE